MCIGAHLREGGVRFREWVGPVDGQAESAGFTLAADRPSCAG